MKKLIPFVLFLACCLTLVLARDFNLQSETYHPQPGLLPLLDFQQKRILGWIGSGIYIRNNDGKQLPLLHWKESHSLYYSPEKKYFGIFQPEERSGSRYKPRRFQFVVYNQNGERKYLIDGKIVAEEMPPYFILSDMDGSAVKIETAGGMLTFYDIAGNKLREKLLFPEEDFNVEKSIYAEYSGNGKYLVVSAMHSKNNDDEYQPMVFLFYRTGKKLWEKNLNTSFGGPIGISDDGTYIIAQGYSFKPYTSELELQSILLNRYGEMLGEFPVGFRLARFKEDNRLLVLSDRFKVYFIDVKKTRLVSEVELGKVRRIIRDLKINQKGEVLVLTGISTLEDGKFIFKAPEVFLLSSEGTILWKHGFGNSESFHQSSIFLSPDGSELGINLLDRFVYLGITR